MFLLIDKPKGITSHDVVDVVRRVTGEKKVGHAGTLDPNATGLLIVGVGRQSTKKLGSLAKDTSKTYEAEVFLGEERDTEDTEGKVISKATDVLPPTKEEVNKVLAGFQGTQKQVPPVFSALKVKGKKAYEIARKGEAIQLEPRVITVHLIELADFEYPRLDIVCEVSSGTYIRSLARDIGRALGMGAYLENLRRTKIGDFSVQKAVLLDKLTNDNWEDLAINI